MFFLVLRVRLTTQIPNDNEMMLQRVCRKVSGDSGTAISVRAMTDIPAISPAMNFFMGSEAYHIPARQHLISARGRLASENHREYTRDRRRQHENTLAAVVSILLRYDLFTTAEFISGK